MIDERTVLDHGYVRLLDAMGNDLDVVRAARVSHDAAWRSGENERNDERLIHFLMRNGHTSPFEMVEFKFEIAAPIFVFRQWHRHRTWSYNEVSARYTELPKEFYVPRPEHIGVQSQTNHQSRVLLEEAGTDAAEDAAVAIRHHGDKAFRVYRSLLDNGVPRELARSVLPLGTYSKMFAKVDLHNLLKFLTQRTDEHAQYEIRVYANAILEMIEPIVPVSVAAWRKYVLKESKNG
jgi:thymidylate synthase (FAD)